MICFIHPDFVPVCGFTGKTSLSGFLYPRNNFYPLILPFLFSSRSACYLPDEAKWVLYFSPCEKCSGLCIYIALPIALCRNSPTVVRNSIIPFFPPRAQKAGPPGPDCQGLGVLLQALTQWLHHCHATSPVFSQFLTRKSPQP